MSRVTRIERLRKGGIRKSGNAWFLPDGRPVSGEERERIRALRVPPAWTDVHVALSHRADLQAIGSDAAGRWQYVYGEAHVRERERRKHRRLLAFSLALPRLRAGVARDLAGPTLSRERVLACMARIIATRFVRPGSSQYERENRSYGMTTLRNRHVAVLRGRVRFDFVGKASQPQHVELKDAAVAKAVRQLLALPGRKLFQYVDEGGSVLPVRPALLNRYIRERMGGPFTAKDFRTWGATLLCADALARAREAGGTSKSQIAAAVRKTADALRNTPAVCRSSYISPVLIRCFEGGRTLASRVASLDDLAGRRSLHPAERALLALLRSEPPERGEPAKRRPSGPHVLNDKAA